MILCSDDATGRPCPPRRSGRRGCVAGLRRDFSALKKAFDADKVFALTLGGTISLSGVLNRGASYIAAVHPTDNKDVSDLTFWTGGGSGLILRSPNGTSFRVTVNDSGALSVSVV
jgi:hypothetical protein